MISFTIYGELVSMKNAKRLVNMKGRIMPIKSDAAIAYEKSALMQIPYEAKQNLDCELFICCKCYYTTERKDLDAELLFDVMQSQFEKSGKHMICKRRGVYANDRQLRVKHLEHFIDSKNPRVEIYIAPRNQITMFTNSD